MLLLKVKEDAGYAWVLKLFLKYAEHLVELILAADLKDLRFVQIIESTIHKENKLH